MRILINLIFLVSLSLYSTNLEAQFLKRLGKKVETLIDKMDNKPEKKSTPVRQRMQLGKQKPIMVIPLEFTSKSPNDYLKDIELPAFRGLPRIGEQNVDDMDRVAAKQQMNVIRANRTRLYHLLAFKYMADFLEHLDTLQLAPKKYPRAGSSETQRAVSQDILLRMAIQFSTERSVSKYLCSEGEHCDLNPHRYIGWGGSAGLKNEFERMASYRAFVRDNFQDLQAWAQNIGEEAYLVSIGQLGDYDFGKQAYAIRLDPSGQGVASGNYEPKNDFEQGLKEQKQRSGAPTVTKYLYLDMKEARALKERLHHLYFVYHIQFTAILARENIQRHPGYLKNLRLTHCLKDPIVEVYEDAALTQKLTEFSIH